MIRSVLAAFLAFVAVLLAPAPAMAKWLKAETPRFVVYGQGDPEGLREYAEKLEIYDAVLRQAHGMDPAEASPRKLDVYLVPTRIGLKQVAPGIRDQTVGFYTATRGDIFAMAIRSGDPDTVVLHEYAHHFMLQYFPASYPAWLIEGYAEYYSSARVTMDKVSVGMPNTQRAGWVLDSDWLPVDQVLSRSGRDMSPEDSARFYAQSWALAHYFLADPARRRQLNSYLVAVAAGGDPLRAMPQATGLDLPTFEKTVRDYARGRLTWTTYARAGFPRPAATVSELPASADDLLLPYLAMRHGMPRERGAALVAETLRPAAARHRGDRFAELVLAYGEMWYADEAAGEALLQGLLARDAKDADALQLLGVIRVNQAAKAAGPEKAGLRQEAQRFLARSHAIRSDDYRTLLYYAMARRGEQGWPTENTLNIITLAYDLAPQVSQVRMLYAEMLIARKQWAEARVVLQPTANNPHGGTGAIQARAMLIRVEAELAKGAAQPATP